MIAPAPDLSAARVVMLAQYLPLHFAGTMRQLRRRVGALTLVLSERMDASRRWQPDYRDLDVCEQKSLRLPVRHRHPLGFADRGALLVPLSTAGDLRLLRPHAVVSVEVGPRTVQAFLLRQVRRDFRLIVQVRESENTALSRGRARHSLRRWLLPRADGVFVNGASGARHVRACGVAPERITVVPSGTDLEVFGGTPPPRAPSASLRLLYVGQLIPRKGLIPFARALSAAATGAGRPIEWTIAGHGPLEPELRSFPWPSQLTLRFAGPCPYHDLPRLYAAADAFVLPSLSDEWGMVVNEAMASGLPVLGCSGAQAVEELVEPGRSGWIYAPGDGEALRAALARLLTAAPDELARLGAHARRRALEVSDALTASAMAGGIARALRC